MSFRVFSGVFRRPVPTIGVVTVLGISGATLTRKNPGDAPVDPAEVQFNTASNYSVPAGWSGPTFKLCNNYPKPIPRRVGAAAEASVPTLPGPDVPPPVSDPLLDSPWFLVDFRKDPVEYCRRVKEYCWEGNVNNDFRISENRIRDWYHAPWMHYGPYGREPLNGLTFERSIEPLEFSKTQERALQNWAIGFYNRAGATVFGDVWANPSQPLWNKDLLFPEGTCVFKILLTDATDEEVPTMKGAPPLSAVITSDTEKPQNRNNFASQVRLIQCDFAVRDNRAPIGWVFGTFMYDGTQKERNPWDRLIPVGLMWGNDPEFTQERFEQREELNETWINPYADRIRKTLGGTRPTWGWNGRLNGPADNYISSCASCHSTAQRGVQVDLTQPLENIPGPKRIPIDDKITMKWFRNIPAGKPFTDAPLAVSGDYSLQLMQGYHHMTLWEHDQKIQRMSTISDLIYQTRYRVPFTKTRKEVDEARTKVANLRAGPDLSKDKYAK